MAPTPRGNVRWLLLLSVAEILTMLTFGNYSAALPVLRGEWGLSAAQAGMIFGAQQVGYAVAVFVLSSLTDVIGVRRIYLLTAVWSGVVGLLFAWVADGFWPAVLLRSLAGIGLAGTYVPGMRLVVEAFPGARRGAAMGVYIACFSLGIGLSLLLTGLLLQTGWRTAFAVTSLGPLAAAAVAWPIVRDPAGGPTRRALALGDALRNARALRFIAAYAAHNWELFGMRAWMPAFLAAMWVAQGLPVESAAARGAAFGSLVLFASALSNAAGGWLSDHVGRRRTIVTFLTASAACSFTIGWTVPLGTAVVVGVALFYGLFVTADSSTLSTAVAESAAPHALGSTLAVQSALGFLVTAVASPLFGIVLDRTASGWGWAFASLGVVALAGAAVAAKA